MTSSPAELIDRLAVEFVAAHPGLRRNTRGSLVTHGAVRAMTSRGRVVIRLTSERAEEVRASGEGAAYKGQPNRWVELAADLPHERVAALVAEACEL